MCQAASYSTPKAVWTISAEYKVKLETLFSLIYVEYKAWDTFVMYCYKQMKCGLNLYFCPSAKRDTQRNKRATD